jgi:hypothetical protein
LSWFRWNWRSRSKKQRPGRGESVQSGSSSLCNLKRIKLPPRTGHLISWGAQVRGER